MDITQYRQTIQILQPALNKLIIAFDPMRGRRNHNATTKNVDWLIRIEASNEPPFAIMSVPSLMMTGAGTHDHRCLTMPIKCISQYLFIAGIYIENS